MSDPIAQFRLVKLLPLSVFGQDVSVTNSTLFMIASLGIVWWFFWTALKNPTMRPGVMQSFVEMLHSFTLGITNSATMGAGSKFLPLTISAFSSILTLNILGLIPGSFTVTSHLSVTFAFAMIAFFCVTIVGFVRHGLHFFSLFLPKGTPWPLAPLMILIEIFTYLSRPLSLAIRLAANMTVGHILLAVVAGFAATMGWAGVVSLPIIAVLNLFELFVAILQAYVFSLLICIYLNDALHLH